MTTSADQFKWFQILLQLYIHFKQTEKTKPSGGAGWVRGAVEQQHTYNDLKK